MSALLCATAFTANAADKQALIISEDFGLFDGAGVSLDTSNFKVGGIVNYDVGENGTLEIQMDGGIAYATEDGLAFQAEAHGNCFVLSVAQAFSAKDALFEDLQITGRSEAEIDRDDERFGDFNAYYAGGILELSGDLKADLGAGVQICLSTERPMRLTSRNKFDLDPQDMVVTRFYEFRIAGGAPAVKIEVSPIIKAGAEFEATLEAFCADANRRYPNGGDVYVPTAFQPTDMLGKALAGTRHFKSAAGGIDYPDGMACVWAATSMADPARYLKDFVQTEAVDVRAPLASSREWQIGVLKDAIASYDRQILECAFIAESCGDKCGLATDASARMQTQIPGWIAEVGRKSKQ
jgi:hypothetical protein